MFFLGATFSFQAHARTAVIFQELRKLISNLLTEKIGNPEMDIEGKKSLFFLYASINLRLVERNGTQECTFLSVFFPLRFFR